MLTFIKNNYAALYENKERVSNFISNFIEDDEGSGGEELAVDDIEDDGHEVGSDALYSTDEESVVV